MDILKLMESLREKYRYDADDESENGSGSHGGKFHGNTRLPYGLANGEGIDTTGMTPKQVWAALAGEGYNAQDVFKKLKEGKTGKDLKSVSNATKNIRPATSKLSTDRMPSSFGESKMRNTTKTYLDTINSSCKDEDVMQFMLLGTNGKVPPGGLEIVKKNTDKCRLQTWSRVATGEVVRMQIEIPGISKKEDPDIAKAKVATFIHEYTHYVDAIARGDTGADFTGEFKELTDAISEESKNPISEKAQKLFDDYKAEYDALKREQEQKTIAASISVARELFGGEIPDWIKEDGTLNYDRTPSVWTRSYKQVDDYIKASKKERTKIANEYAEKRRAACNGNTTLQGLYDSVSKGRARAEGKVKYGHALDYFKKGNKEAANELLADYISASILHPEFIEIFENDYPKTAKALRNTMLEITKKLGGN